MISDAILITLNCVAYKNGIGRLNNFSSKQKQGDTVLNAPYLPDLTCSISHGKSLNSHPRNQGEVTISNALSGLLLILGQPSKALKYCEKVRKEHFYLNSLY
jgi:hypothetical protein